MQRGKCLVVFARAQKTPRLVKFWNERRRLTRLCRGDNGRRRPRERDTCEGVHPSKKQKRAANKSSHEESNLYRQKIRTRLYSTRKYPRITTHIAEAHQSAAELVLLPRPYPD